MKRPDIPSDEPARLQSLRSLNILDTPAEERFDRVTRMARRMFGVPIVLVSLVDDRRQWFKSRIGLDVAETSRDVSFCGHAINGTGAFVVSDARDDVRFADNPLVLSDPQIRFYAGYPLSAADGSKIGTLCLIDRVPRQLDDQDIEVLRDLASLVEDELAASRLASIDDLTGLCNRRGFMLLARHALHLCARHAIPTVLAYLDLDRLKHINDSYGHAEGDRAIVAFSDALRAVFRESDLTARIGGDEFVALFLHATIAEAEASIERLRATLEHGNRARGEGRAIGFTCGLVAFDGNVHGTIEALLADGDARMYSAKPGRAGRVPGRLRSS